MNGIKMREVLGAMSDFANKKSRIEHYLEDKGHICVFLLKFHPEVNPIECVWSQAKWHTKPYCNYTLSSLWKNIPDAFNNITQDNIKNYFRKVRHYMIVYLKGHTGNSELEDKVRMYKQTIESHQRIGEQQ